MSYQFYQTPCQNSKEDVTFHKCSCDLTLQAVSCALDSLKASSLNNICPKLHEICRSDPHLLETAQRGHNGRTYPCRETSIRRSCDLDGSSSGSQLFQFLHKSFFKPREKSGAPRQHNFCKKILLYISVTLHNAAGHHFG